VTVVLNGVEREIGTVRRAGTTGTVIQFSTGLRLELRAMGFQPGQRVLLNMETGRLFADPTNVLHASAKL
jgi:hypothetical protein